MLGGVFLMTVLFVSTDCYGQQLEVSRAWFSGPAGVPPPLLLDPLSIRMSLNPDHYTILTPDSSCAPERKLYGETGCLVKGGMPPSRGLRGWSEQVVHPCTVWPCVCLRQPLCSLLPVM